ncbi:MAG: type II toxin-antitoxin system VapC family toxin [Egibacteraceae bacterium]
MRRVFIDTGAFVALRNASEQEHEAARSALRELLAQRVSLFTSNYVFAETYTALLVRVGRHEAVAWGAAFRAGTTIDLVRVDEQAEDRAWQILEAHADKRWSYVDATSFALMEQGQINEAFAFDRDFAQRGLQILPSPSQR